MCAYYSNSNICDRTDTSSVTYYFIVKYIRSYDIDMYFVFYGLHDTTLQICIISLYEYFANIMI